MTLFSGGADLPEQLTELGKTVYLPHYQFIKKDVTQEQPDGTDARGKVWGKDVELPRPL